jgi:sulfur carrier protein
MRMKLTINGQDRDCPPGTLRDLWQAETEDLEPAGPQGFAIALNGFVVRQSEWDTTPLSEGDTVEIIRAMQGG